MFITSGVAMATQGLSCIGTFFYTKCILLHYIFYFIFSKEKIFLSDEKIFPFESYHAS